MNAPDLIDTILNRFSGVVPKQSWGETALFFNPGKALPNGAYFLTIKEANGENDRASQLDREGVYRLSIGIAPAQYEALFGIRPARPDKGKTIEGNHDFSALDKLMPHPIYSWISWVQILNPSDTSISEIFPLIEGAYSKAVSNFERKLRKRYR